MASAYLSVISKGVKIRTSVLELDSSVFWEV
jgi:hypothetical protein